MIFKTSGDALIAPLNCFKCIRNKKVISSKNRRGQNEEK